MESGGRKPAAASSSTSSSFSTDLFGPKESSLTSTLFPPPNTANSSSTGIFSSVFPPVSGGLGRDSRSEVFGSWRKENPQGQAWNGKQAPKDGSRSSEIENQNMPMPYKEGRSIFVDTPECSLSSSLYYGGRDICAQSPSTRTSGTSSVFKKDGEEGEGSPPGASRGNWWQGSLYY